MIDRVTLAKKLVDNYQSKALELLVDCLQNQEIRTATEQYIGQHEPSPVRFDTAPQHPISPQARSRNPDSSPVHTTARQHFPDARNSFHTPPNSAGSVKSRGSSLAVAGTDRIYLLSCEDDCTDQPVIFRSSPVKHNLIKNKVAYGRSLGAKSYAVDELVSVPLPSGNYRQEKVFRAVDLTWRRRGECNTNMDTFYIVPAETFDCDVILAADGSTERQFPSEVQEAHSPQAHYQRGSLREIEELGLTIPPSPQQNTNILPQRAYDRVQSYREAQSMQAAAQSTPIPHASQTEQGQVHRTAPVAAQGTSSGHLQVLGLWDQTLLQMSFDPNAPGEAFYQAFHRWAVRRNRSGDIERHRITLWLKTSRDTPDETAYELILKEGDLEDLWGMAVDWIQGNKNPKPPHLYATVELQAV